MQPARGGDRVVEQTFSQAIAVIAADSRSGAAQIAERAADLLFHRASASQATSPEAFRRDILATGWALIHAQTVMAPLVNLVNGVLWSLEPANDLHTLHGMVGRAIDEFKRQLHQNALHMAERTLGLIGEGSTIITLSYSSTIQHALIHAQRAGRHFEVLCAESQPGYEGREAAALLRRCGLSTVLVDDQAALTAIAQADLVLVGADMLTNRGLVNRVGTFQMALAAGNTDTPFYTLCSSDKFLPPGFQPFEEGDYLPGAMPLVLPWHTAAGRALYDFTPIELLSGIITEQGILPVVGIEAWLAATRLHPALANYSEVAL